MKRLTEKDWDCVSGNVFDAVRRLQEIENILGDDYDLDRMRNAVTDAPYWMCPVCCGCTGKKENGERTELCKYPEDMKLCEERQKRLLELAEADRDGRCVILPCKVGDTAYVIDPGDYRSNYKPYAREKEVTEISWKKVRNGKDLGFGLILKGGYCNTSARYKISNVGKTVFLTREDAEAALKGETHG